MLGSTPLVCLIYSDERKKKNKETEVECQYSFSQLLFYLFPLLILSFPFFAEREELLLYVAGRRIDSEQIDLTDDQSILDLLFASS